MKSPRHVALDILIQVETRKGHPDDLLTDSFKRYRYLSDLDRSFITELAYGTLRWQGKIDWVIARYSEVKTERIERVICHILRLGVYQILFLTKTPHRAAVNEAVILAKRLKNREAAGFVNALLRRIARETASAGFLDVDGVPQEVLAVEESFPLWVVRKLWDGWGAMETRAFCQASNRTAPLSLRVNALKTDRDELMKRFVDEGLSVSQTSYSPDGILIEGAPPVSRIPLLESGYYQIQDEAAQLVTCLVNPQPGERILDACAAPGGKTTHMGQRMENRGKILAVDVDEARLKLIRESCRRMGVSNVTALKRDMTRSVSFPEAEEFDAILLDVPCTGWGTIRRNPDIKWRTKRGDITRLASIQRKILDNVVGLLKKGGRIVYSTCTVFAEENENVVESFLKENRAYSHDDRKSQVLDDTLFEKRGFFRSLPHRHNMDGFFAARLTRS